ncbi:MAG: TetR/AcrR family transcriptional regulator [Myxococcales bacterium]|nr:TetR/AcrR family transcriptional regulator [Myxococcales bacterium]
MTTTAKGKATREEILKVALKGALSVGLEGLSIGGLATEVGMSKSGLFAHFGSKEGLQIAVLEYASERFVQGTVRPALRAPRGEPRVRSLLVAWLDWAERGIGSGGCVFESTAWEFDARPGAVRSTIQRMLGAWVTTLQRAAQMAVEVGDFRDDLDAEAFAQHAHSAGLGFHLHARLFRDPNARRYALSAIDVLIADARAREDA